MNTDQALIRNMGTCHPDAKGEVRALTPRDESTDAGYRGGLLRSSDETFVMNVEQRQQHVRFVLLDQPVLGGIE